MEVNYIFPKTFNPDDINIRLQHIPVSQLNEMIQTGKLLIADRKELQRMSNVWNVDERSAFVESVMANLPVPMVYLDGSRPTWTIIDGLQRICSLYQFIHNEFVLSGLDYFQKECEGCNFNSIPAYLQHRILSSNLVAYVINPGNPESVKFNIFRRINRIGKQRNREELRNAFFQQSASRVINELAESFEFLSATQGLLPKKGMKDRELVCRYFAFQLLFNAYPYEKSMDDFLDKGMDVLAHLAPTALDGQCVRFKRTMFRCHALLEEMTFVNPKAKRKRISKSLFDTFAYAVSRLSDEKYDTIVKQKRQFKACYIRLFEPGGLGDSKLMKDSSKKVVDGRFSAMNEFILQFAEQS